jgi:polysaccharide export outer membrane protein
MISVKTIFFAFLTTLLLPALSWTQGSTTPQSPQLIWSPSTITPEDIDQIKTQYPELKNYSNQDIQKKVEEGREKAAGTGSNPSETNNPEGSNKPSSSEGKTPSSEAEAKNKAKPPSSEIKPPPPDDDSPVSMGTGANGGAGAFPGQGAGKAKRSNGVDERFPVELERFGESFFRNTDMAAMGANAPALPEYILSPGDEIQVYTWGRDSRSQSVVIDNEGMFSFQPLVPLRLAGLRFAAAQKVIIEEVQKMHGVTASVSLGKLRSIRVMVLGEAVNPGAYVLPGGITVTAALFRCGGISSIGSLRGIEVRRGGRVVATLDIYDMLLKGESRGDIQLLPGDAIFIPIAKVQVAVHGMVKRPAIYEVKGGLRALDAVQLAGGLKSSAFKGRVRVDRVQNNKRNVVLDVDMEKIGVATNVVLQDGDILFVDRVLDRLDDAVTLMGNVHRPGRYQYKNGMTVRDVIPTLQDLKPETFFEYAHIRRPAADDDRPILLNFSLTEIFQKGTKVPLLPRDVVVIYSRYDVVERPTVKISGKVRRAGTYPYGEAMSISDLVIMGGGLGDAYLPEAHLLRALPNGSGDSLYTELVRVNLKNILEDPASGDNLELRPFDSLVVFARQNFMLPRSVSIYGTVQNEGTFELSEGMGIPELVKHAAGFTKNSFKLSVEVARRTVVKDSIFTRQILKLNLKALLEGSETFALQDGDRVYIREVVNSREYASIVLQGEFTFPGRYEFMPGEKLSNVIRRAGGFTKEAYLRGAVFLREGVKQQQLRHAEEVGRRLEGQLQARLEQTTQENERTGILAAMNRREKLLAEIASAPYLGRVVVQVDRNLKFAGTDWDLELENEDTLKVGPHVGTVSALGEVYSPTTLILTRKTNQIGEVLAKAGGVNGYGDYDETFYVAPDGSISTPHSVPWYLSFKCKEVEAGGTIIVPLKPPAKDYLEVWAEATQILYQIAISVGVAKTLF